MAGWSMAERTCLAFENVAPQFEVDILVRGIDCLTILSWSSVCVGPISASLSSSSSQIIEKVLFNQESIPYPQMMILNLKLGEWLNQNQTPRSQKEGRSVHLDKEKRIRMRCQGMS